MKDGSANRRPRDRASDRHWSRRFASAQAASAGGVGGASGPDDPELAEPPALAFYCRLRRARVRLGRRRGRLGGSVDWSIGVAGSPSNRDTRPRRGLCFLAPGVGAAHLLADRCASRARSSGHRLAERALRNEAFEAECPPRSLIAQVFDAVDVNQSDKASAEAQVGLNARAAMRFGHSRMRIAVACGQPRRGRSIASPRSISTWVVRTRASSQA